jgi:hypothetical protein
MSEVGRNDPCPCGSGKKYKKCHGATLTVAPDFKYDRIRRLDGESGALLVKFAREEFGPGVLEVAWKDFQFGDDIPYNESNVEFNYFLRWLTFCWRPSAEETLAERCLRKRGKRLEADLRRFIELTVAAPYSYYQILETKPGAGMRLRDILRKSEVEVMERTASMILEKGNIIFARAAEMDGVSFFMGNGACPLPPSYMEPVLELREFLEEESDSPDGAVTAGMLLEFEEDLREEYFELAESAMNPSLDIRNTEGDPLVFCKMTYGIPSLERAFHALKDLEQKVTGRTDADMLTEAETGRGGKRKKIWIHWYKKETKRRKSSGSGMTYKSGPVGTSYVSIATLEVTDTNLIVEANSKKRAQRIRKEIAKRLGDEAVLLRTETTPLDQAMAKAERGRKKESESEHDRIMKEHPELKTMMKQQMEEHWASWPDMPLTGLRGMTPREAVNDDIGRELLESVLLDFEVRNQSQRDELLRVDVEKLRRKLRLR